MRRVRSMGVLVSSPLVRFSCCAAEDEDSRLVKADMWRFVPRIVINVTFESGSEKYRNLERGVFVGAGRFIWDGRGLGVEYKVSRVGWHAP